MRFDDQVVFITGAAHGIGAATARRLHSEGATVVIADHDQQAAEQVVGDLAGRAVAVPCDVTDRSSVDSAMSVVRESYGRLDQLITVAGASRPMPVFDEQPDELWEDLLEINLVGVMRSVRAAVPLLKGSDRAAVVMISSVNGVAAFGEEGYGAAKAGISNLAMNLAVRYAADKIRFNVIAPGTVNTRVWQEKPESLDRMRTLYPLGRI
ncbi:MAG TPA: SDR family oxidoreductase, partial [Microlunatus sp.]